MLSLRRGSDLDTRTPLLQQQVSCYSVAQPQGTNLAGNRMSAPRAAHGGTMPSTLARGFTVSNTYRTAPACFNDLDDAALSTVVSYLTAVEFSRFQVTCKRTYEVGSDNEVWSNLLARDFVGDSSGSMRSSTERRLGARMVHSVRNLAAGVLQRARSAAGTTADGEDGPSPKALYRRRFLDHKSVIESARRDAERRVVEQAAEQRGEVLRVGLDCGSYIIGLGTPCLLLFLWLLLLLLKLSGAADISFSHVWLPIWVCIGVVLTCWVWGCGVKCMAKGADRRSAWYNQEEGEAGAIAGIAETVFQDSGRRDCGRVLASGWLAINAVLAFIVFPALVLAKVDGHITAGWGTVFVPVWLIFGFWCCMPLATKRLFNEYTDDEDNAWILWGSSLFVLWAPLLCVAAMVVARLEGKSIEAVFIFIPLFVVDVALLLAACVLCVVAIVDDDRDDRLKELAIACGFCLVLAIFLPAQIIASIYDHAHGEFPVTGFLLPLVIGMAIMALCGCLGMCKLWNKASADSPFENAYSNVFRRWCTSNGARAVILPGARA